MAANELKVVFKWENGESFEMTAKRDADDSIVIVKAEENTCFNPLWEHFKSICLDYLSRVLDTMGNEMKA